MPGRFASCQLAWQVNQLSSQEGAEKEPWLVRASLGPRASSRALPASGLGVLAVPWLLSSWLLPDELAGGQTSTFERYPSVRKGR